MRIGKFSIYTNIMGRLYIITVSDIHRNDLLYISILNSERCIDRSFEDMVLDILENILDKKTIKDFEKLLRDDFYVEISCGRGLEAVVRKDEGVVL